jgi:predicted dehydrogenase
MNRTSAPLRIAVVGAGGANIATAHHLPALAHCPQLELVALCDINAEEVNRYAEQYGVPACSCFDELLDKPDVDAVLLCTPDWLHVPQAVAAGRAGKHVLCEKPIALSVQQLDELTDVFHNSQARFMPAHVRRFTPYARRMAEVINQGSLGRVVHIRITTTGAFFPYPPDSPYYREETGGQFIHNGPHYVDLLLAFVQSRAVRVYGLARRFYPDPAESMESPNLTLASVRFQSGVIGLVEQNLTRLNPRGYPPRETIEITGNQGSLVWNSHDDACSVVYDGQLTYESPTAYGRQEDPFAVQLQSFAEAIRRDTPFPVTLQQAVDGLSICLATLESARAAQPMVLDKPPASQESTPH